MCVTPDGTVYTDVEWDEAGREVGVYKDGKVIGRAGHTHGWGNHGGSAIAVTDRYVFFAQAMENEGGHLKDPQTWPPAGLTWYGISRRLRSDLTKPAPFPGGKGGKGDTLKGCFLVVNEVPEKTSAGLSGLCADANVVFASNPLKNQIEVFDAESMERLRSWSVDRPAQLALDSHGALWALQSATNGQPARVLHFGRSGQRLPQTIELPMNSVPKGLCLDPQGRLLVADCGPDQQIHIYDNLDGQPRLADSFGERGGILGGEIPGHFWPRQAPRFNEPVAVGCDAAGNIYVANDASSGGGGTVLESYTRAGQLNWRLFGLEFVDMADVDPASDQDVFTKEEHFRLEPSEKPAGADWRYEGYTINRFEYPDDPRLHIWSAGAWVRRIDAGPRLLFVNDMNAEQLQVYRFDKAHGEIAIPSGLFAGKHLRDKEGWPPHQPAKGEWIWRDRNGNGRFDDGEYLSHGGQDAPPHQGWWVDRAGNIWLATETKGIREFTFLGFDPAGNPRWSFESMKTYPHPAELRQVKRLRYDPDHDVMYLGGTTDQHRNQHWKPMGPVICRYDHWSRPDRKLRWKIVAPYAKGSQGHSSCEPMGFDVAGEYVFVPYTGASKAIGFSTGHIEVFKAADGASVGHMEPPAAVGEIGLQDIRECLRAHQRLDGEYLVFLEEDWKSKILVYQWRP